MELYFSPFVLHEAHLLTAKTKKLPSPLATTEMHAIWIYIRANSRSYAAPHSRPSGTACFSSGDSFPRPTTRREVTEPPVIFRPLSHLGRISAA